MDLTNITALDDEALELISPSEPDTDDVELDNNEDIDYESEPDGEYLDEDEQYDDDDSTQYDEDGNVVEDDNDDDDDDYIEALEIDGIGEVPIEEILEWQKGNMRQSDYTKKTQELAKQRAEMQDAVNVYNYLRANPNLLTSIADGQQIADPNLSNMMSEDKQMLRDLYYNQKTMEIERQVESLRNKYGDVDEVALYNKAKELNTDDLEFVYKSIAYDNASALDPEELREQIRQEVLADLNKNKSAVKTVVNTRQANSQTRRTPMSAEEKSVAEGLGISPTEYAKWRG